MPTTSDLVALGVPAELAQRLGFLDNGSRVAPTIAGAGTTQPTATVIKRRQTWLQIVTSGGQTAVSLPADAELLVPYLTYTIPGATAGLLFPSTGFNINGGTVTTGSVSVPIGGARLTMRIGATQWVSFVTA